MTEKVISKSFMEKCCNIKSLKIDECISQSAACTFNTWIKELKIENLSIDDGFLDVDELLYGICGLNTLIFDSHQELPSDFFYNNSAIQHLLLIIEDDYDLSCLLVLHNLQSLFLYTKGTALLEDVQKYVKMDNLKELSIFCLKDNWDADIWNKFATYLAKNTKLDNLQLSGCILTDKKQFSTLKLFNLTSLRLDVDFSWNNFSTIFHESPAPRLKYLRLQWPLSWCCSEKIGYIIKIWTTVEAICLDAGTAGDYPTHQLHFNFKAVFFNEMLNICDKRPGLRLHILDHTTSRLLLLQEDVVEALKVDDDDEITIILQGKWGGDGSADQSQFNQKFNSNVESSEKTDANLFATTFVPLRMTTNDGKIVWNNATPQSPRWCRPIRLQFAKETPELTLQIIESVEKEIQQLIPYETIVAGKKITVTYKLYLTMIDGKVHGVITHTSAQTCSICKATPKQFNNLKDLNIRFKPIEGTLNYGVSVMHLWIRCFEFLLHISYRIDVKPFPRWQMRGPVLKKEVKRRKGLLQKSFWEKMSLRVDFPSKKGSGNSNSGPVARSAFSKPELLAEILELDVDLIKKISTILIALSCQLSLDTDLFPDFCEKTAHYYVAKYDWFPMPQSVHKVLIHSRDLMLANDLPLGVLAEDAAESCNKFYRHNRQFHARNVSRQQNLMDVFNRALDTSDPIISSFTLKKRINSRHRKNIPTKVLRLLKAPDDPASKEDETLLLEGDDDDENLDDTTNEILDGLDELNLPADPIYGDDDDDEEEDDDRDDEEDLEEEDDDDDED